MGRDDVVAEIEMLIDGELPRGDRLALLARLVREPGVRALLGEALELDRELAHIGACYDAVEPSPGFLGRVLDELDAVQRGAQPGAVAGLTAAVRRILTPLAPGQLAGIMAAGTAAETPHETGTPGDPGPEEDEAPAAVTRPAAPARSFPTLLDPADGRVRLLPGAGAVAASAKVHTVELGALRREDWHLLLKEGRSVDAGPGRLELRGDPGISGRVVLIDGSSLAFTAPLALVWESA